jgi:hypothetical protein
MTLCLRFGALTDAPCGSPEKVEVLCQRASHGLALWNPADNPDTWTSTPQEAVRRARGLKGPQAETLLSAKRDVLATLATLDSPLRPGGLCKLLRECGQDWRPGTVGVALRRLLRAGIVAWCPDGWALL